MAPGPGRGIRVRTFETTGLSLARAVHVLQAGNLKRHISGLPALASDYLRQMPDSTTGARVGKLGYRFPSRASTVFRSLDFIPGRLLRLRPGVGEPRIVKNFVVGERLEKLDQIGAILRRERETANQRILYSRYRGHSRRAVRTQSSFRPAHTGPARLPDPRYCRCACTGP